MFFRISITAEAELFMDFNRCWRRFLDSSWMLKTGFHRCEHLLTNKPGTVLDMLQTPQTLLMTSLLIMNEGSCDLDEDQIRK